MNKIVFVCTGNTCRSPMAEGIAKKYASNVKDEVVIYSRGISVRHQDVVNEKAVQALQEYGIDIKDHKAKQIMQDDMENQTIVLTMSRQHKNFVINNFPNCVEKVYTIKEYIGLSGDVADPYGQPIEAYKACALELDQHIEMLFQKIN